METCHQGVDQPGESILSLNKQTKKKKSKHRDDEGYQIISSKKQKADEDITFEHSTESLHRKKKRKKHVTEDIAGKSDSHCLQYGEPSVESESPRKNGDDKSSFENEDNSQQYCASVSTSLCTDSENNPTCETVTGDFITSGILGHTSECVGDHEEDKEIHDIYWSLIDQLECAVSDEMISRMKEMFIFIDFEVPKSHTIEKRIDHAPSEKVREEFAILDINLKHGHFNKEEDELIKLNWNEFSETYNFKDPKLFTWHYGLKFMKQIERLKFAQFLGKGLPERTLFTIYSRFQRLFGDVVKRKFSKREEQLINYHMQVAPNDPHKYAKLAKMLNRSRAFAVSQHHRYIMCERNKNGTVIWNLQNIGKLVKEMMKTTGVKHFEDLRHMSIPRLVWMEIARKSGIDKRANNLLMLWNRKLYTMFFAEEPIFRNAVLIKIFQTLRSLKVKHLEDVDWGIVATHFHGYHREFLNRQFKMYTEKYITAGKRNFGKFVKWLVKEHIPILQQKTEDKQLQRLRYIKGKGVTCIDGEFKQNLSVIPREHINLKHDSAAGTISIE